MKHIILATAILIICIGCSAEPEPEGVFIPFTPTATAIPDTELVRALKATAVAEVAATHTPAPTYTPAPTITPIPTATITPTPTATPLPYHLGVPTPNAALDSAVKFYVERYGDFSNVPDDFTFNDVVELAGIEPIAGFEPEILNRWEHWLYRQCESAEAPGRHGVYARDDYPLLMGQSGVRDAYPYLPDTPWTWKSAQNEARPHYWVLTCE